MKNHTIPAGTLLQKVVKKKKQEFHQLNKDLHRSSLDLLNHRNTELTFRLSSANSSRLVSLKHRHTMMTHDHIIPYLHNAEVAAARDNVALCLTFTLYGSLAVLNIQQSTTGKFILHIDQHSTINGFPLTSIDMSADTCIKLEMGLLQ